MQSHNNGHPQTPVSGGTPGLRFVLTSIYMFLRRTRGRDDALDWSAEFLSLSVMTQVILSVGVIEYAKHGMDVFRVLFKENPNIKIAAIGGSMVLYLVLSVLFKRLVSHRVIRELAGATRPAVGVTVGAVVFFWTLASPFVAFLVIKGTFAPVFRFFGVGR